MSWFEWAKQHLAKWKTQGAASNEFAIKFTPRAQQVLRFARDEANRRNHNFLGTEHLLLGLIELKQGVIANAFQKSELDLQAVRLEVEKMMPSSANQKLFGTPYTPRVKRVLTVAQRDAKALNHIYVGTEHILLGLLAESDGVAARALKKFNLDFQQMRKEILNELKPNFPTGNEPKGQG